MLLPARLRSALGVPWNLRRGETCASQLLAASFARDTPVGAAHPQLDNRLLSVFVGTFWMANQPHLAMLML